MLYIKCDLKLSCSEVSYVVYCNLVVIGTSYIIALSPPFFFLGGKRVIFAEGEALLKSKFYVSANLYLNLSPPM